MSLQRRSVVLVLLCCVSAPFAPRSAAADDSTSGSAGARVVFLNAREPRIVGPTTNGSILARELFRQALLLAARDGFGLLTRDMTLGESVPTAVDSVLTLDLEVAVDRRTGVVLKLRRGTGDDGELLWETESPLKLADPEDDLALVELAESLARREFPAALRAAGLRETPHSTRADTVVTPEIEQRLLRLNLVDQFAAVRALHARINEAGEAPALVGALARAYANLAVVTGFHWRPAHRVFKARALLCAERRVVLDGDTPSALGDRACVRALTGYHRAALRDLESADRAAGFGAPGDAETPQRPALSRLADSYCRFDTRALLTAAEDDAALAELAELLAFLTVEDSRSESLILTTAELALKRNPALLRAISAQCDAGGVVSARYTTVTGPLALSRIVREHIARLEDLPPMARAALFTPTTTDTTTPEDLCAALLESYEPTSEELAAAAALCATPRLVAALVASGRPDQDAGEPSWETLGRLIEDALFVVIYWRGHLLGEMWGVDTDEYLRACLPLIAAYPYEPFIRANFDRRAVRDAELREKLLRSVRTLDADQNARPLFRLYRDQAVALREYGEGLRFRAGHKLDNSTSDRIAYLQTLRLPDSGRESDLVSAVSPFAPAGIAELLVYQTEAVAKALPRWETEFAQHPALLHALAERYRRAGRFEDAERCYRKRIAVAPDHGVYRELAAMYREQDHMDLWQQTLDESLSQPDYGLSHATARQAIANYLMSRGEFDRALPYAEAAASTHAGLAMICASKCHEGLQHWPESEQWIRRTSQRYPGVGGEWFLWCVRTGRGDRAAAAELADQRGEAMRTDAGYVGLEEAATIHLLRGRANAAREFYQRSFTQSSNPYAALHVALLAHAAGDTAGRDAALEAAAKKGPNFRWADGTGRPELVQLAKLLQAYVAAGAEAAFNHEAFERLVAQAPEPEQANVLYFGGRFLSVQGQPQQVTDVLRRCAESRYQHKQACHLSREWLRSQGVTPKDVPPLVIFTKE